MNQLTCYELEGEYYQWEEGEWVRVWGHYQGHKTYWATPPSAEQIAVASLRLMGAMNRDREFWPYEMKIDWIFSTETPLKNLLDQLPSTSPILEEYTRPAIGHASSPEPIWPYVVGAAVLLG